jgi:NTE family protein
MAFHLGCLRALNDVGLLSRIDVISTISGGSVIGAYYAYTPEKSFAEFEQDIRRLLRAGFQGGIAQALLRPINLLRSIKGLAVWGAAELCGLFTRKEPSLKRTFSRTELFREVLEQGAFLGLRMNSPTRDGVRIVLGACELRTGTAFRFGNDVSGGWRHGVVSNEEISLAFAVTASAAYPIFLPALDRTWRFQKNGVEKLHRVLLTDGGIYDNLGIHVLEPGRNPAFSLHCFPCDYIIACNAGCGQGDGQCVPLGFYRRVKRSFEVVHRRVQESTMHHLHQLRESGVIKGFALPYLGQIDEQLPFQVEALVPRAEVIGYPTNFAAMSDEWIDKLSARGKQLTSNLINQYLRQLV